MGVARLVVVTIPLALVLFAVTAPAASTAQTSALSGLRQAADRGEPEAQFSLGVLYVAGRGVERNDELAVSWFRRAADQGHAVAQYNLGVMYADGSGVERNDELAVLWFRRAAEQGDATAQQNLENLSAADHGASAGTVALDRSDIRVSEGDVVSRPGDCDPDTGCDGTLNGIEGRFSCSGATVSSEIGNFRFQATRTCLLNLGPGDVVRNAIGWVFTPGSP